MPERDEKEPGGGGISRRGFLKGLGAGSIALPAAGLLGSHAYADDEPAAAAASTPQVLRGQFEISLKVNGEARSVKVEPRTTLLDALRGELDLTGSKLVCDRATCGACTVIIDGQAITSCMMLAVDAEGRDITTIEGLAQGDKLDPIQEAFVEVDALQCGFCTPGFIMATKAALDANPAATLDEVKEAISGNICRCGTYNHIFKAVEIARSKTAGGRG